MFIAIISIGLLAAALGLLLGFAAIRFKVEGDPITDQIDAILPQTQCGQCGFPGCRPYAEAIAAGEAEINRCPPGGEATIQALADLLGKEPIPLDEERGEHPEEPLVAKIIEDYCIGCTLCIQACPVDAIIGAAKQMHTVITDDCTGCDLCPPACPVDTIDMVPLPKTPDDWIWEAPDEASDTEPQP
jgi:electron transport complex protein RnfB